MVFKKYSIYAGVLLMACTVMLSASDERERERQPKPFDPKAELKRCEVSRLEGGPYANEINESIQKFEEKNRKDRIVDTVFFGTAIAAGIYWIYQRWFSPKKEQNQKETKENDADKVVESSSSTSQNDTPSESQTATPSNETAQQ